MQEMGRRDKSRVDRQRARGGDKECVILRERERKLMATRVEDWRGEMSSRIARTGALQVSTPYFSENSVYCSNFINRVRMSSDSDITCGPAPPFSISSLITKSAENLTTTVCPRGCIYLSSARLHSFTPDLRSPYVYNQSNS